MSIAVASEFNSDTTWFHADGITTNNPADTAFRTFQIFQSTYILRRADGSPHTLTAGTKL